MRPYHSTEAKFKMAAKIHPEQRKEIMEYFKEQARKHEEKQVKARFDVEFSFTEEDIVKAKAWEHDHHYNYDDLNHLLLDAFGSGVIDCPRRQII